jgi:hypothetical protein
MPRRPTDPDTVVDSRPDEPPAGDERAADAPALSALPGDGALSRLDAVKDDRIRRWDVVTPSATLIGRADRPDHDVSETVRRLHDEQHPAMQGHASRMHRLEKARISHALCNTLDVTTWERDRVLGIMTELDLTVFGSQRAIERVALVVLQHVVDDERQRRLGLHDQAWLAERAPFELEELHERFTSLKDDDVFRTLLDHHDMDVTTVNRLGRILRDQLDDQDLHGAVLGRSPYRDPSMPALRDAPARTETESGG